VLALTENATETIEGILAAPAVPDGAGLRIAPAEESSDGAEAGELQVTIAESPAGTDEVVAERGARVFVDEQVATYLDGKLLDARIVGERVNFVVGEAP
jgi:iron-sulfur cluster assembly protein